MRLFLVALLSAHGLVSHNVVVRHEPFVKTELFTWCRFYLTRFLLITKTTGYNTTVIMLSTRTHLKKKYMKRLYSLCPCLQRTETTFPAGTRERGRRGTRRHHAAILGTTARQGQAAVLPEGAQRRQRSFPRIDGYTPTRYARSCPIGGNIMFHISYLLRK